MSLQGEEVNKLQILESAWRDTPWFFWAFHGTVGLSRHRYCTRNTNRSASKLPVYSKHTVPVQQQLSLPELSRAPYPIFSEKKGIAVSLRKDASQRGVAST
jgi:hypothetical protein